jgi:nucleotide-binding universal stress UspA family protein
MIERILLPLDGSERAEAALPYAVALHRAFGSRIVLLRVVETRSDRPGLFSESEGWRLAQAQGRSYLEQVARRLKELGVEPVIEVVSGNPADEIRVAIRRWETSLVILSSSGEGGAEAFPCGGTTGKVIGSADSSFLVIRGGGSMALDEVPLRRVVVPVDGSTRGNWALNLAAALAQANGAELLLVHVVARPELLKGLGASGDSEQLAERLVEANRKAALRFLDDKRRQLASPDLDVNIRVAVAGSVPRAIQGLASRRDGSLLVLCAHGQSAGSGLAEGSARSGWGYGGVASILLFQGSGPILVFQDLPRTWPSRSSETARYARATQAGTTPTRDE